MPEEPVAPFEPSDRFSGLKVVTLSVREAKILTSSTQDRRENYTTFINEPVQFATLANGQDYATWILEEDDGVEYTAPIEASSFALSYASAITGELDIYVNGNLVTELVLEANFQSDWFTPMSGGKSHQYFSLDEKVTPGDRVRIMASGSESNASIGSLTFFESEDDVADSPIPDEPPQNLEIAGNIESNITGIDYPITIYLPYDYYFTDSEYPVIYVLDGQFHKSHFSYVVRMLGLSAIVVAIDEGPTNRRATDYLAPGIFSYFTFLETELIPYIESRYRASEQNRTITGASASGLAVGFILLNDDVTDPVFENYYSFDGPFFSINRDQLEESISSRRNLSEELDSRIVLVGARLAGDIPPFDQNVRQFRSELLQNFTGMDLHYQGYDVNHFNSTGRSWPDFVDLIFD